MDLTIKQDENFATSLNPNARFGEETPSSAKFNYQQALARGKSSKEVAADAKLANAVGVTPEVISGLSVADKAEQKANAFDWAKMHQETPVLMKMMDDPTFAAEVSDDPREAGMWERLWWHLAPTANRQGGVIQTARNSITRGGYGLLNSLPFLGNERVLEDCHNELRALDDATEALKNGKSVAEVFGSEEDPTGESEYARFITRGEARKKEIYQRMYKAATSMAWANNMKQIFPQSVAFEALSKTKTAGEAFEAFAKHPITIALDVGLESLVQQAPQIAALGVGAALGGAGLAAVGQGATSYTLERGARLAEGMSDYGLNSLDVKDIMQWYGAPEYRAQYNQKKAEVQNEAAAVGFTDAIAGGLATKTVIPKGFMGLGERTARVADVGAQALLQGSLGSAGEAASQYITHGEVTSWADIIAEFAGEFTTSPIDVAAASLGRTTEAKAKAAAARAFAERTAQLEQYAKVSTLLANDPKTAADYIKNIQTQSQVPDLFIDAQSLHQSGNDSLVTEASPELAERYQQALTNGESMKISAEELFTLLAPRDTNNALAEVVHPEDMPSLVEAQSLEQTMAQETTERLSQSLEGVTGEFATSSANVGKRVENMLTEAYGDNTDVKAGGMSSSARKLAVTYLQTLFTNIAKDLGVLPEQVFDKYGPQMFLSPADATRTADGKLQITSDRAKGLFAKGATHAFGMPVPKEFGPVLTQFAGKPKEALAELRKRKTGAATNVYAFQGKPVGICYGKPGDAKNAFKGGYGLSHIDAKHPGVADNLQEILDNSVIDSSKDGRLSLWDGKHSVAIALNWMGDGTSGSWVITAYVNQSRLGQTSNSQSNMVATETSESGGLTLSPEASQSLNQSIESFQKDINSLSQNTIGDWFPDVRAIATWAGANRSTFLHETGHMFLDMRVRIAIALKAKKVSGAELTKGEQHLLETAEAAMVWLGTDLESFSKMSINEQRPMHEKFARSYEAYLMEGHSPSSALTKIFRSFSGWLRGVYRLISNIPEAEISPEVRDLFDTMLVASSEVETARLRRAQFERYNDPQLAAIAQEMGEDFADLQKESADSAVEDLQQRLQKASSRIAKMRQGKIDELTDEAQRIYNEIFDRIWEEVMSSTVYQAHGALTEGINGLKPKLTKKDLESIEPKLTPAQIKLLEDMDMVGTNPKGVNAQMVVEKYGFDSLSSMVFALIELGDPTQRVRDLTTTEMLEKHAELASPEAIERMADAAIFNDARLRILAIEAMAFNRALGKKGEVLKQIREGAKTAVGQVRVADMAKDQSRHATEAARNGREAEASRQKGDIQNAAAAKVRELYQAALVRVLTLRRKEIGRALKFFDRFKGVKTLKTCDTQYLMAIQHILDRVGIANFPDAGTKQRQSLAAFLSELNTAAQMEDAEVKGIDIDSDFVAKIDSGELTFDNMTSDQFDTLEGLVREIYTLGRNVASVEVEGQRVALEEARADLAEGVNEHATAKGRKELANYEQTGRLARIKEQVCKIGLSHRRIPSLLNCLEGAMPGYGRFFKYITRRFDECGNREAALKNEVSKALFDILSPLFKELSKSKPRYYESLGLSFTKQQIFVMALNMGNAGNIQRLIDNSSGWSFMKGRKLTEADVMSLISQTLTADELNRVQAIWNLFATMQELVEAKEVRMRGRAPAWVNPQPIAMGSVDGQVVQLSGGYYPIVYDRLASSRGQEVDASKGVLQELKGKQGQASTWKGHLKDRAKKVEQGTPVTLTLRGAFEGFENTIHDVCWDAWVTDTRRLFGRNSVLDTAIRTYYGAETLAAIRQWIKDAAVGKNDQASMCDGLAVFARQNISLVGIGFNLVTAAIQTVGITQTVVALGGKWTLSGVGDFVSMGPMGAYKFAASKSLLIQDRIRTQFREIAEIQRFTNTGGNKLYEGLSRMAYMPVAMVQMAVDLPTWLGAYNRALAEGKAEAEAVAMADRMLIEAQGSGRFQDLSGVERSNAWVQLITVFYTFFNTTYNLARLTMDSKGKIAAARDLLLLLVAQPVIETFVREALKVQPPDDDEDEYWERMEGATLSNTINFNMSLLVGLRELASLSDIVTDKPIFQYQGPTGVKKVADIGRWVQKAAKEWSNEDGMDPAFIRQSITVFSEITGAPIPVVPINRYLRGKQAIDEGDTTDWKAYLFGYTKH